MKNLILLSAIAFTALSCEKNIDYDLPREDPKLVVDARIITGEPVTAFVSISRFVLDPGEPQLTPDATVVLFEDGVEVETLQYIPRPQNGEPVYRGSYLPQAGKSYRLEASQEGYVTVYGEDMARPAVAFDKVEFDSVRLTIDVTFTDPSTPGDYYRITAYQLQRGRKSPLYLNTYDPFVQYFYSYNDDFEGDQAKYGKDAFLADEAFNGQQRSIRFEEDYFWDNPGRQDTLLIEMLRISADFYRHEQTKGGNYVSEDNPFAEPVQIYTNVVNGYGIVAAGSAEKAYIVR